MFIYIKKYKIQALYNKKKLNYLSGIFTIRVQELRIIVRC